MTLKIWPVIKRSNTFAAAAAAAAVTFKMYST